MDPTTGPVTQVYGANPQFPWQLGYGHLGMDWGCSVGTVATAIAPGRVLWADWGQNMPAGLANECMFIPGSPNSGICVVIQHDGWRSVYAHLNSTHLNAGNQVNRGQEVGRSGNTGNSTGAHLHFEVWTGVPASNVPTFGRYNPALQIAQEDRQGGNAPAPAPAPAPVPAARPANQRQVGPVAMPGRKLPFQGGALIGRDAPAKGWEAFTKWTRGENVLLGSFQSDIWYGDKDGWYWSGGFESQTGNGLTEVSRADAFPANYRLSGAGEAMQRSTPTSRGNVVRKIAPFSVEQFSKWTRGENVKVGTVESNIWYGDSAGWVWAGMFTEQSGRGLTEVKPETLIAPNQRVTKQEISGSARRATPHTSAQAVDQLVPGQLEVFSHWTRGDMFEAGGVKTDVWYKDSLGYAWAGRFTDSSTNGLPEFVFVPGTTAPSTGVYTFTKAFAMVTEVRPAARGNFEPGNFPAAADVANAYLHQFNAATREENATVNRETVHLDSVINTFQGTGRVASAHFGVEGTRVVQFVDLKDRAYAQGPGNADGWSIETYGAQDAVTMATAAKLVQELQRLKGAKLTLKRHKEVMATACGNGVDLAAYRALVDAPAAGGSTPPPATTPPPAPVPAKESAESLLGKLRDQINQWFSK